jgi:hypothetical protein
MDQVTARFGLCVPETLAVNCCAAPMVIAVGVGAIATPVMVAAGVFCEALLL